MMRSVPEHDDHLDREIAAVEADLGEKYGLPVEPAIWRSDVRSSVIEAPDGQLVDKDELLGQGDYAPE